MQVGAFSIPNRPGWRWRIINYAGETVEESRDMFATIALAVASGTKRVREMAPDRSVPRRPYRTTSYLRSPGASRSA
jgi:hypothetical protein